MDKASRPRRRFIPIKLDMMALFFLFLMSILTSTPSFAQDESHHWTVYKIADPDGWANTREGPSSNFDIVRKAQNGEVVLVSAWPNQDDLEELKYPRSLEDLRAAGLDPDNISEWRPYGFATSTILAR